MKRTIPSIPSGATQPQLRAWAYLGAWECAVAIVTEFPSILIHLNAFAAGGTRTATPDVRQIIGLRADGVTLAEIGRAFKGKAKGKKRGPKTPMTTVQRKALADNMRRRWKQAKKNGRTSLQKTAIQ